MNIIKAVKAAMEGKKIRRKTWHHTHYFSWFSSDINLIRKLRKLFCNPKKFIKDSYLFLVFSYKVDYVGDNWNSKEKLPIAVFLKFDNWKKEWIGNFLPNYKTVFVSSDRLGIIKKLIKSLPEHHTITIIGWGAKTPSAVKKYAKHKNIEVLHVEDGFLRSFNPGALHRKPFSLVFDSKSIYFNANEPSDIENYLNTYDFNKENNLLQQAKAGIEIMKAARLTKYYDLFDQDNPTGFQRKSNYSILVIGQVEGDASIKFGYLKKSLKITDLIRFGSSKKVLNIDLIKEVRAKFPDADIYYRPHPDVVHGNRKNYSDLELIKQLCTVVDHKVPLSNILQQVDHVYTITSLVGLEALIFGLKVTCMGVPFYSGWGLTEDMQVIKRRKRKLTLEELFAISYLSYPLYLHPCSNEKITFFELASYFLVEKVKWKDLFDIPKNILDIEVISRYPEHLSPPAKLLLYINSTKAHGMCDVDEVMKIANSKFNLADCGQVSILLINSANYDALAAYCNLCIKYLGSNFEQIKSNRFLLENLFDSLLVCLRNRSGRVMTDLPNLNKWVLENISTIDGKFTTIAVRNYICILLRKIQYTEIEDLINELSKVNYLDHSVLRLISGFLLEKPKKNERNALKRSALLEKAAELYKNLLTTKYSSVYDVFLNIALHGIAIEDNVQVLNACSKFLLMFNKNNISKKNKKSLSLRKWSNFSQRFPQILSICAYLIEKGEYELSKDMIKQVTTYKTITHVNRLWLVYWFRRNIHFKFIQKYKTLTFEEQHAVKNIMLYTRTLLALQEFGKARNIMISLRKRISSPLQRSGLEDELSKVNFIIESNNILRSYPQPKIPKGVIFIASLRCFNTLAMLVPSLLVLKQMGYAIINLVPGMLDTSSTGLEYIDKFSNCLPTNIHSYKIQQRWYINWGEKEIIADNVNFYQGFYECLSINSRKYFVDINEPEVYKQFYKVLKNSDACLTICQKIFNDLVEQRGIPVVFVAGNSHIPPYSIFRDFARHKNHKLMSFVSVSIAYENYFSNLGSKTSHTMCVTDMTLYPNLRAPFLPRRDMFEKWYEKNRNNDEFLLKTSKLIQVNRNGSSNDTQKIELINFLKKQKILHKKVICCFGKIPVDLNVPYDGGPAHEDMADWINHTISICGGNEDIILLIKPHPHELRPEIALDLVEGFADLISVEIKSNIYILNHKEINTHELVPYLDLAILWNGSSSLELTAQGVSVMMCSYFGKHDYPVDLIYPADRAHYEQYLLNLDFAKPNEELRNRAAFLITYMGTDEISILNDYSLRQVTNDRIGIPRWKKDKIKEFLEKGDPNMELVASRIVEKFTNRS
jgi:capsular polysaccharide export protein